MTFPLNGWYRAAWAAALLLPGGHMVRRIAGKSLIISRSKKGRLSALLDCCPHRFAPLSRGTEIPIDGGACLVEPV